jgi:hypothetical protein
MSLTFTACRADKSFEPDTLFRHANLFVDGSCSQFAEDLRSLKSDEMSFYLDTSDIAEFDKLSGNHAPQVRRLLRRMAQKYGTVQVRIWV